MRSVKLSLLFATIVFLSGCPSLLFFPQKGLYDNPTAAGFKPDDVYFKTSDGLTLHGWFFRADERRYGTILVLHGNAENLSTHVNSVLWLVKEGFNVFIFDYRGYGRSEGKPSVKGVHLDAEDALKALFEMPDVDKERIAVLGQSIGGAIAVYTAANSPDKQYIKALVLDSAFSGYRLIAREKLSSSFLTWPLQYPLSWLFNDDYSPIRWISKVSPVPVLLLHGDRDLVIPSHHSMILFDAALEPREFWQVGVPGHVTSFADAGIRRDFVSYLLKKFGDHVLLP